MEFAYKMISSMVMILSARTFPQSGTCILINLRETSLLWKGKVMKLSESTVFDQIKYYLNEH